MSKEQPIDVRDMAIIHRTFRAGYTESARLVRAAPAPSPERVTFLADHIDFAIAALHIHHEGEDELLYPKLIERVPDQAPMTEEVEHEHQLIKTALESASAACAAWRERPSAETGEALAAALDQLNTVAQRHLDDEEQKIVPLAAVAGNSATPSSPPTESSAAATCTSVWVSTPPVMARACACLYGHLRTPRALPQAVSAA